MVGSAPSAPTPPDPVATANAQGAMNAETARTQARLNRVNQYGPDGTITYAEDGSNPDRWTMYTQLSPENQNLYDLSKTAQTTYGTAANNQLNQVSNILANPFTGQPYADIGGLALGQARAATEMGRSAINQPVNTDYNAVRQQAIDAANSRLQPQFHDQEQALRTRLLNSGIAEGSEQWNRAYRQMNEAQNDSRQQTLLNAENLAGQSIAQTGQLRQIPLNEAQGLSGLAGNQANLANQGLQQALALRTQPLNEAQALLTGSAVQSPLLQSVPQTQVAPTDYIGAVNGNYAAQMANYNAQRQSKNAGLGGMFGIAGTLGGAALGSPWLGGMLGNAVGGVVDSGGWH